MRKLSILFCAVLAIALTSCGNGSSPGGNTSYHKAYDGPAAATASVEGNTQTNTIQGDPNLYPDETISADKYNLIAENEFVDASKESVSTFSIDADGASYANVRRFILDQKMKPPTGAIRTEELINYFDLEYPFKESEHPIALNGEVSDCPWNPKTKLVRIGIKGKNIPAAKMAASNFVFLIDISGSMSSEDKLELLKQGFMEFTDQLRPEDRVAIVTYAGRTGVALASTSGDQKDKIKNAIRKLGAGGSTAGAGGIKKAYQIAKANFIEGGNNRVILGTDGDFNVGISSQEELVKLIEGKRDEGIYLTALGVGRGNYNDAMLEQVANHGNGTFEYIDKVDQLKKVFIYDYSKFYAVAKDVKVQVDFNPEIVKSYRLIGYENRVLNEEDFEDDTKDAGEIGANQNITALYEIEPNPNLNYQTIPTLSIDFRYKLPDADTSIPMNLKIFDQGRSFEESSDFMKFTASVASYSMLLLDSKYKGNSSFSNVGSWLSQTNLRDDYGFKNELKKMVAGAQAM